jgi:nucleotide-binding universal stress UspA family protein
MRATHPGSGPGLKEREAEQGKAGPQGNTSVHFCPEAEKTGLGVEGSEFELDNVLGLTDLTEAGNNALLTGLSLARRAAAGFIVISAIEPLACKEMLFADDSVLSGYFESLRIRTARRIRSYLEEAGDGSVPVHVAAGDPADLVAAVTSTVRTDLVVIGPHRRGLLERLVTGASGERIIRRVRCPVLVANSAQQKPFSRILVATDLSESHHRVMGFARRIAEVDSPRVRVVHAEKPPVEMWPEFPRTPNDRESSKAEFIKLLQNPVSLPAWEGVLLGGPVGSAILRQAEEWDADLIVMGIRRHGFPVPSRLGSDTRYVLRHGNRSLAIVP